MTAIEKFAAYKNGMIEVGLSFFDLDESSQEEYTALELAARAEQNAQYAQEAFEGLEYEMMGG